MNTVNTVALVEQARSDLLRQVNLHFDRLLAQLEACERGAEPELLYDSNYESVFPLSQETGMFKKRKPTAVLFAGGRREEAYTWKSVMQVILQHCYRDAAMHDQLLALRGRVNGRQRVLLSHTGTNMCSPVQIGELLYVETNFDAPALMRTLVRILDMLHYDYSRLRIVVRREE